MKKVVITGATGMIGSALIRQLIDDGIEVYAVIRPNSTKINNLPKSDKITIVECDVDNMLTLTKYIPKGIDVFYNFAWNGTYGESRFDSYLQNQNIKNTLDSITVAKELGCKKFVGAGSQAEYGVIPVGKKIDENLSINPICGYGVAKYTSGKLGAILAKKIGIEFIWTRILSVYGVGDNSFTITISTINKLFNKEIPIMTKGEQIWDFLYCDDAAKAFYLLGEKGIDGQTYVIGSGIEQNLRNCMETLRDCINPELEMNFGGRPYNEKQVMYLVADISKLCEDTGFIPKFSFKDGIQKTINWLKVKTNEKC
jgi:nucleoside-diphosphate-sugar epimerase